MHSDSGSVQVEPETAVGPTAKAVHSDRIDEVRLGAKAVHPVEIAGQLIVDSWMQADAARARPADPETGESIGDVIQRAARAVADAPFHPTAVPVVHPEVVEEATAAWFGPRVLHHTAQDAVGTPVILGSRDNAGRLRTTTGELFRHDPTRPIETIAHHVPVSREVLDGLPTVDSFVRNTIAFRAEAPLTPERAAELAAEREATSARLKRVRARRAARDVARTAARRARGIHPPCTHEARGDDDW